MKPRSAFLIGIILGQLVMIPYIWYWKSHPVVEAIPIPTEVFNRVTFRKYEMKDVPHRNGGKRTLTVYITSEEDVRALYKAETGEYNEALMGFYNPDKHVIITVDSTDILVHEMRHVFEGAFHRGPQNDSICN